MTIVVDTVAEVMNLQKYLSAFGVTASPLIGRSERLKYINQVAQPYETCLSADFSQYLTPLCLVDGMDAQHSEAVAFGKEPCYTLKKGNKTTGKRSVQGRIKNRCLDTFSHNSLLKK